MSCPNLEDSQGVQSSEPHPPIKPRANPNSKIRRFELRVNGNTHELEADAATSLLYVLRNDLRLNGPKYGCGYGQCGACTVHVDGVAARACVIPAVGVAGRSVTTLEGLGSRESWHPVQEAFNEAQAAQCGYCLNGMVMQAAALLEREPRPTEERIRAELSGNLCRCGTHIEILRAIALAATRNAASNNE